MRISIDYVRRGLLVAALSSAASFAHAEPTVIKMIVPFPAGGITDQAARIVGGIAEGIQERLAGIQLPKFRPGGLLVVHAGGDAGLFSAIVGGWVSGDTGSAPVTREVRT